MEGLGVQRIRKGEGRESVCVCVKERERTYLSFSGTSLSSVIPFCCSSLTFASGEKNWCIEMNTIEIPNIKFMVKV